MTKKVKIPLAQGIEEMDLPFKALELNHFGN